MVGWNRVKYEVVVVHEGLDEEHLVKATDKRLLIERAESKMKQLDKKWDKLQKGQNQQQKLYLAKRRSERAEQKQLQIESILIECHVIEDKTTLDKLFKDTKFKKSKPAKDKYPSEPVYLPKPREPQRSQFKTRTGCGCLTFLVSTKKQDAEKFRYAHDQWNKQIENVEEENRIKREYYEKQCKRIDDEFVIAYNEWSEEKLTFEQEVEEYNSAIKNLIEGYDNKKPEAVGELFRVILDHDELPTWIPRKHDTMFNPNNGILAVEGLLPDFDEMPVLEIVRYVKTRDEFVEKNLAASKQKTIYDKALYQLVLRSIYKVFQWDINEYVESVVFNGFVESTDKATGKQINPCILSIQVSREEFVGLNLEMVDPKECFRKLKGIASSQLFTLTPVAPVLRIEKDDRRFVEGKFVVEGVLEGDNLAAMDWEDFEHLIREIFEKEFAASGGEVKVTRASRDGGVDAVVFDPDPIKGGKVIIQAKRYTNTVGVSAVRDLYGTLLNEGANKGILVSTSDYGPDAYSFAKGKPIVLLNGSELLYLLEKHGHKARIDIKEAKILLAEQGKQDI